MNTANTEYEIKNVGELFNIKVTDEEGSEIMSLWKDQLKGLKDYLNSEEVSKLIEE